MVGQVKIEIKIMYDLHHPNIIKLFNHFEEDDFIYLILEYASGGTLWQHLTKKGRLNEKTAQQYMREMVSAIDYCHTRVPPIIHRDIKPENILLDGEGHAKLADFGWSTFFHPGDKRQTYCGTLVYLAPEMIEESGHDVTLDYWSLGILTYELLTGKDPFTPPPNVKDPRQMQAMLEQNILKGNVEYPKDFPFLAKDLATRALKTDRSQRITIEELRQHPWLTAGHGSIRPSVPQANETLTTNDTSIQSPTKLYPEGENPYTSAIKEGNVWTTAELERYSSRPEALMSQVIENNPNIQNSMEESKVEDLFQRFSVSTANKDDGKEGVIEDLNKTVKSLRDQNGELEVKLKLREKELQDLKKENELMRNQGGKVDLESPEGKRIQILDAQKANLKKEIEDIWKKVEGQEADLQKKNIEIKRLHDDLVAAGKYKIKKTKLKKELKDLREEFKQAKNKIVELEQDKEEDRYKYEKMLQEKELKVAESFSRNDNQTLKDLVDFAKSSMDDMQQKITHYRDKSENLEKLKEELDEKKGIIVRLETDLMEQVNEVKRRLESRFEDERKNMEEQRKSEVEGAEKRYRELISTLESDNASYRTAKFEREGFESKLDGYKNEVKTLKESNETLKGLCQNLQTLKNDNERKIYQLSCDFQDLQRKYDLLNKSYSKGK